jgi:hypothetical protein
MDADRFDALSRALSTGHSRRRLTRLLGGLSLGGVLSALGGNEAAAAKLNGGARCTTKTQCKSGRCLNPNKCDCTKSGCRCTCACSTDPVVRCIVPPNPCKRAVCTATGQCVMRNKCTKQAPGTCGRTGACSNGTCLMYGTTTECGTASCSGESTRVSHFCNGSGSCVAQEQPCGQEEPATCGGTGICNEGVCTKYGRKTECGERSCLSETRMAQHMCDGNGTCERLEEDCRGSKCVEGVCRLRCQNADGSLNDDYCFDSAYCEVNGSCVAQKANGQTCDRPRQCTSGFCVDGTCCNTNTCAAGETCQTGVCQVPQ